MSIIATAVRHLMVAGVTGDALLSAIAEMEAQVRAEPKLRTSGAIRQERYRRNKASQSVTCDGSNACDVTSDADVALSLPPNENNSNPPTHTHRDNNHGREEPLAHVADWLKFRAENARKAKEEGVKPHRMPADWQPGPLPPNVAALVDLWPPGRFEREADACRDFWLDKTEKRPGWDRTFHNRIRDIHDRVLKESRNDRPAAHRSPHASPAQPAGDGLTQVLRRRGAYGSLGLDG